MSYRYVSSDGNAYIDDDDKTYRVVWGGYNDESARIVEAEKDGERGRFMQLNENVVIEGARFDFDEFYEKGDYIDIDHSDEKHLNIIREDEFNRKYTNAVEIRAADPEKSPRPPESIAEKTPRKLLKSSGKPVQAKQAIKWKSSINTTFIFRNLLTAMESDSI